VQNSVIIKKTILWSRGLKGLVADMLLDEASVTGSYYIVAAVLAKGKTTVYNAA
jgi:UDP-N-acetylglucosamine enolpyruvyl transferase